MALQAIVVVVRALSASVGAWGERGWETASGAVVVGKTGGAVVVATADDVMGMEGEVEPDIDTRLLERMLLRRE